MDTFYSYMKACVVECPDNSDAGSYQVGIYKETLKDCNGLIISDTTCTLIPNSGPMLLLVGLLDRAMSLSNTPIKKCQDDSNQSTRPLL